MASLTVPGPYEICGGLMFEGVKILAAQAGAVAVEEELISATLTALERERRVPSKGEVVDMTNLLSQVEASRRMVLIDRFACVLMAVDGLAPSIEKEIFNLYTWILHVTVSKQGLNRAIKGLKGHMPVCSGLKFS